MIEPGPIEPALVEQTALVLKAKAGLVFSKEHLRDVEAGMSTAMQALGVASPAILLARVVEESPRGKEAFNQLVQGVTIGETYFFRYPEQFTVLRERVLAPLIERKRASGDWSLRLWSAACSTGEEAYSLAMTIAELLPDLAHWRVSILGTDINLESLTKARVANYGAWSFRGVKDETKAKYFHADGPPSAPRFRLRDDIKRMVHFHQLNLNEASYPQLITQTTAMDVVFCRNVLIYFSEPAIREVALRLHDSLVDGGSLFLGPAEPNDIIFGHFRSEFWAGTMLYRRDDASRSSALTADQEQPARARIKPRVVSRFASAPKRHRSDGMTLRNPANDNAEGLAALGFGEWREGRLEQAKKSFLLALAADESLAEPSFMLAVIEADRGQTEAASQHCLDALRKDSMDVRYYHLASILEAERGEHQRAIDLLRKAIFLDRKFIMGHFGMGVSYRELRRADEAARYLRNCLELLEHVPDDATVPGVEEIAAGWLRRLVQEQVQELAKSSRSS